MFPTPLSGSLSSYGRGYSDDPFVNVDEQRLPVEAMQSARFTAHAKLPPSATSRLEIGILQDKKPDFISMKPQDVLFRFLRP